MRKQYVVRLAEEERAVLRTLISQGDAPARVQTHARILLKANRGEAARSGPTTRSARRWRLTQRRWHASGNCT